MKLRYLFIVLGCILGAGTGMLYWYIKHYGNGAFIMDGTFALDFFYGALLGVFLSYFLSQLMLRREA